jgi:hypothetical protein
MNTHSPNTSKATLSDSILEWLARQPASIPLRAVEAPRDLEVLKGLLSESQISSRSLTAALMWLRIGEIEHAHTIVQDDKSSMGSYLHGIVHRLEGDYWNAKYWFKQVRDSQLLSSVGKSLSDEVRKGEVPKELDRWLAEPGRHTWGLDLTNAVERTVDRGSAQERAYLERLGFFEWNALWEITSAA